MQDATEVRWREAFRQEDVIPKDPKGGETPDAPGLRFNCK